jgi:hypothetical protein
MFVILTRIVHSHWRHMNTDQWVANQYAKLFNWTYLKAETQTSIRLASYLVRSPTFNLVDMSSNFLCGQYPGVRAL